MDLFVWQLSELTSQRLRYRFFQICLTANLTPRFSGEKLNTESGVCFKREVPTDFSSSSRGGNPIQHFRL
ncbi:MAG: hypothetical protein MET45_30595 [Nostoc sp. LLA-1]|nr:hypothetical protein [Cyanocohniella sp. LLY]